MRLKFEQIQTIEDMLRLDEGVFREFVANMFHDYGDMGSAASGPRDYGADLVMTRDDQRVAVQARQNEGAAGVDDVRDAHFAKHYYGADEAWVVSASGFTGEAVRTADDLGVHLVTGAGVLRLVGECTFDEPETPEEPELEAKEHEPQGLEPKEPEPEEREPEEREPEEPAALDEPDLSDAVEPVEDSEPSSEPPDEATPDNDVPFSGMFDGPAHELRALKFDTYRYGDPPRYSWGFLVVDRGAPGLNSLSGEAVDDGGVRFWVELDEGRERGYYALRSAGQGSEPEQIVEGHLESKVDERGTSDPSRRELGPIKTGFSVYLYNCHLIPSPGIDGAKAARVEEDYRRRVTPLVDEFWKVNGDKSDRGKLSKRDKLAALDGLHDKIRSTNVQFVARAKEVGLDHGYYVSRYGGSIGNELAPSARAARAKEMKRLAKARARSQSSGELMGCLAEGCLKGCYFLIMAAFAVMMLVGYLMILLV